MSEPEKEEKPGVSQDPLWFIYDETVTTEGMFRSTVPSSQSGAESMSFRCKQQTTKGQMPYLDIMSTRCGDYISSSSLKDQLEPHTRLFIEPISIPVMKHVGIRSELTDAKRSSHLVLEENEDDEEDENIISKTKSNASKIKKLRSTIKKSVRSMYDSQRSSLSSGRRSVGSPRKLASLSTTTSSIRRRKKNQISSDNTLESEWFEKYRKSKVVKDRKARAMLRHLRAIGARESFPAM